jgi:hypothetical protein
VKVAHLIATQSCQLYLACRDTSLALAPERSRHSGGNDSVSSELSRQRAIVHALGPDGLTQAISLGYFSLGQQRKVTRSPQATETLLQDEESPPPHRDSLRSQVSQVAKTTMPLAKKY